MTYAYANKLRHRISAHSIKRDIGVFAAASYLRGNGYPLESALVLLLALRDPSVPDTRRLCDGR